jgi:hypothetical protein
MSLTRRSFSLLALGAAMAPGLARAQTSAARRPCLIELFTSQGCSSCPTADALMVELADDPAFIPVTFATQIWDYLGWKDTLARPQFTKRHKAYAQTIAGSRVYTPQAVINGATHAIGSDRKLIMKSAQSTAAGLNAGFTISRGPESWDVSVEGQLGDARLVLIPVMQRQSVEIARGENSGRTITYANVARDVVDLGEAAQKTRFTVSRDDIMARGGDSFVILAQQTRPQGPGPVLGVAFASTEAAKV